MRLGTTIERVPFSVVFVCTGNRARSPLAEAFLRAKIGPDIARVESYGTVERVGEPAMPEAIAAALPFGIDIRSHRTRSLRDIRLDEADLVVGFELIHIAAAVVGAGAPRERAFLFRELIALLEDIGGARGQGAPGARAMVALAHARRTSGPQSSLLVSDPYGSPQKVYDELTRTIDFSTSTLSTRLFGFAGEGRPGRMRGLGAA